MTLARFSFCQHCAVQLVLLSAFAACSSTDNHQVQGAAGGAVGTGGQLGSGGTLASGGSVTGGTMATAGAANSGGAPPAGGAAAGGDLATAGASTGASGGSAGSAGGVFSGGAPGIMGGAGGSAGATASLSGGAAGGGPLGGASSAGGSGGAPSCAGKAVSFTSNVAAANDPAKSRVMVDFGSSTDLPIHNGARTFEFWAFIHANSWAADANTLFEYGAVASNQGFGLDFGGQKIGGMGTLDPYTNGSFDNDNQNSGLAANMDQWAHLAMTYDGSAVRLFVNGVQKASKTSAGNMLNTMSSQVTIGGNPRGDYFDGMIDEFRIWNVARSASEISSTMNKVLSGNEPGLVAYFKFDDGSGTTAMDSTTTAGHTAHNGTLMAASGDRVPQWVPSTAPISCQ